MFFFNLENQALYVKRHGIKGYFSVAMENFSELLTLNFLFVLTSLPVITLGASYCAMCEVCICISRDDVASVSKKYFSAFKNNFLRGSLWGIFSGSVIAVIAFSFIFYLKALSGSIFVYPICAVCISCFIMAVCVLGNLAAFVTAENDSFFKCVGRSFVFTFIHFKESALYFLLLFLTFFPLFALLPYTAPLFVFPWVFLSLSSAYIYTEKNTNN